jgi:serine/threonine protein phosphatase PrpC
VDHFVTRSGLRLDVAVVCDGVGGEEHGERAAQLSWIRSLATCAAVRTSSPTAYHRAPANAAVYAEAERLQGKQAMACTMVLALIVDGKMLHIANVGDSRHLPLPRRHPPAAHPRSHLRQCDGMAGKLAESAAAKSRRRQGDAPLDPKRRCRWIRAFT